MPVRTDESKYIFMQIYELLKDGQPHSIDELRKLCGPSRRQSVISHIFVIRRKVLPENEAIACVIANKRIFYQLFYRYDKVTPKTTKR